MERQVTARVPRLVVRALEAGDVDQVMAIQQACLGSVAAWPPQAYRGEGGYESLVAVSDGCILGFLLFFTAAEEVEILNLAVSPRHRRQGIGAALLRAALAAVAERGARRVFLEVRESNSDAAAFYQRLGFTEWGRRPRYYSSPPEDAVVLSRPVASSG